MKTCLILIINLGLLDYTVSSLSCKSPSGSDVDWFILYKVPQNKQLSNGDKTHGTEFFYMQEGAKSFEYWNTDITKPIDNPLYDTLGPVYSKSPEITSYAMYNDQPPAGHSPAKSAHSKGAVAFDNTSGFWIVSSVPNFPAPVNEGYKYQKSQTVFGQTILCVTLTKDVEATIKQVFKTTDPYIFDRKNFVLGTGNVQPSTDVSIKTKKNVPLKIFGKSAAYGKDIYSDLIQPKIGETLQVETWRHNQEGSLKESNAVKKVPGLRFSNGLEFDTGVDHSKWAVAASGPWTCIGDINRHKSQFKRGGLSVCMDDSDVAREFRELVVQSGASPIPKKKARPSPGK